MLFRAIRGSYEVASVMDGPFSSTITVIISPSVPEMSSGFVVNVHGRDPIWSVSTWLPVHLREQQVGERLRSQRLR